MLSTDTARLLQALNAAALCAGAQPEQLDALTPTLDRPRDTAHGDQASNLALQLARPMRQSPRALATRMAEELGRLPGAETLIARVEVAGPGFLNIWLQPAVKRRVVLAALDRLEEPRPVDRPWGDDLTARGAMLLEFVSANPTGPLHVGHGRQAALGDVLAALMASQGYTVSREFYYNDAGGQIHNLALSVQAHLRGVATDDPAFPADGYRGEYIADIARAYAARDTVESERVAAVSATGDAEDLEAIRAFAVAWLRREQDLDLAAFGVAFDHYYLESSLYEDGLVEQTVDRLVAAGRTYEADGALWLRTTDYGDDKDRVMRKAGGGYTYFVPDVAYHTTKWNRGFTRALNIQGSDHHGTIARVRAGLQALDAGIPPGYPDYVLHKMVRVVRGGAEVKLSKRAGSYVTLRDLIEWSGEGDVARGRDAVRYFLVSRKADSEFTFDIDLALARSDENPVYYVQYAHARICSVLAQARTEDVVAASLADDALLAPLDADADFALMARIGQFPDVLAQAITDLAPHPLPFYLRELAAAFHTYYNAQRVLVEDEAVRRARLALLLATRQVLARGMQLLGVSAPERM